MILGIGIDVVNIDRIDDILGRYGDRFINKIFSLKERETSDKRINNVHAYAKRWAAKEALVKALGLGFPMGMQWKDICVYNSNSGQPRMGLTGGSKKILDRVIPINHIAKIHLSLSDDYPWAHAMVLLEAIPTSRKE